MMRVRVPWGAAAAGTTAAGWGCTPRAAAACKFDHSFIFLNRRFYGAPKGEIIMNLLGLRTRMEIGNTSVLKNNF
jgi:hypothetical protein